MSKAKEILMLLEADKMTPKKLAKECVLSLENAAEEKGVSLQGITRENFNTFLDDLFDDGGETRVEKFTDLPDEYALQFGELESPEFDKAKWEVLDLAFDILEKKYK